MAIRSASTISANAADFWGNANHKSRRTSAAITQANAAQGHHPSSGSLQKAESKPRSRKIASACAAVRPRKSGDRRSWYQDCARLQTWATVSVSPRGVLVC